MEQLSLPFKNDDIDKWNYLIENTHRISFSVEQHEFVIAMKRKHGWSFGDKVELDGSIIPWGFEDEEWCETCDPEYPPRYSTTRISDDIADEMIARPVEASERLNARDWFDDDDF